MASIVTAGAAIATGPALSADRAGEVFVAVKACEAFQSKNRRSNPGGVRTEPLRSYEVIARNAADDAYVLVRVPGAPVTPDRWVDAGCGVQMSNDQASADGEAGAESTENLLALSWQPAFCESVSRATECRALNRGALPLGATRLSIHGLWAQPSDRVYCDVPDGLVDLDLASRWDELPPVQVDGETWRRLREAMPGTASYLERHEWLKHGTCHRAAGGADGYFDDLLQVADAVNASPVSALFAGRIGDTLATAEIRAVFDAAFGRGAGARVGVECADDGGETLVLGLRVSLRGRITPETPVAELILAADPVPPGCRGGLIDPPGLQ